MHIRDVLPSFIEAMADEEDLSPNTIRAYVADARTLEQFIGGASSLAELGPADIERFADHLLASGLKRSSARRRIAGVRKLCSWLSSNGWLDSNPAVRCRVKPARERILPKALSVQDAARLLIHLKSKSEAACQTTGWWRTPATSTYLAAASQLPRCATESAEQRGKPESTDESRLTCCGTPARPICSMPESTYGLSNGSSATQASPPPRSTPTYLIHHSTVLYAVPMSSGAS